MKASHILLFAAASLSALAAPARSETLAHYEVFASTTDPGIYNQFDYLHQAFILNGAERKQQLVVFIPGSDAEPRSYTNFLVTAANLGYRAIGISYVNSPLINQDCTNTPNDCDCQGKARFEVVYGTDVSTVVACDVANCIENRIVKFLQWLESNHPGEGWGQYIVGGRPYWSNIIVSGHSQGAGMAGFVAKSNLVHRCVMFSDADWCEGANAPANWLSWTRVTPIDRVFAFVNSLDTLATSNHVVANWQDYGLFQYGPIQFVEDVGGAPYDGAHTLMTALAPQTEGPLGYHDSPVVDSATPIQDGQYVFKPVWEFCLDGWTSGESFDGDNPGDIGVYRPANGQWYLMKSADGYTNFQFGYNGTVPVEADYDGDGRLDVAVYDSSRGLWNLLRSRAGYTNYQFGFRGTEAQPKDFDGDKKADLAVYNDEDGMWYFMKSREGYATAQFGYDGTAPVPGDYDGDGRADLGVYDLSNGQWYLLRSNLGYTNFQFGYKGTTPAPADYDNDGKVDPGVYDTSSGQWYIQRSNKGFTTFQFGYGGTDPLTRDFDSDGRADSGVFDPRTDTWYIQQSTAGFLTLQFGFANSIPLGTPP